MSIAKIKMMSILLFFGLLSGCSVTQTKSTFMESSQGWKKSYPKGFCAVAVNTHHLSLQGKYPDPWTGHRTVFSCDATIEAAQAKAMKNCYYGCEIAYDISIATKQIINSYEDYHLSQRKIQNERYAQERQNRNALRIDAYSKQCDSFGFTKETTAHSNCIMQLQIADNMSAQIKESSDAQTQEMQKMRQQQALDSLNQSLKDLNRPANRPSVNCIKTITGFNCN